MAHNLNFENGNASLYLLKEPAWHGFGQISKEAKRSEEVIQMAQLDYEVVKCPNFVNLNDSWVGTGSVSTVRTDTGAVLGNRLTDWYTVMQNREAFAFLDDLVIAKEDITYESAGALGKGEVTFVTAKLPNYIKLGKEDIIENYIVVVNSHDGSYPLSVFFTPVRIVCNNTLNAALRTRKNSITIRHTSNLQNRLNEGRMLLDLSIRFASEVEESLFRLSKTKMDDRLAIEAVNKIMMTPEELQKLAAGELPTRKKNMMDEVYEALYSAPGQEQWKGTALHVYNGITSYFQNVKDYASQDRKMKGVVLGGPEHEITRKAMSVLMA